jgi:hypothetical protein
MAYTAQDPVKNPDGTVTITSIDTSTPPLVKTLVCDFDPSPEGGKAGVWAFLGATETHESPGRVVTIHYDETYSMTDATIVITRTSGDDTMVATYTFGPNWENGKETVEGPWIPASADEPVIPIPDETPDFPTPGDDSDEDEDSGEDSADDDSDADSPDPEEAPAADLFAFDADEPEPLFGSLETSAGTDDAGQTAPNPIPTDNGFFTL